jgi:hypothetical protein
MYATTTTMIAANDIDDDDLPTYTEATATAPAPAYPHPISCPAGPAPSYPPTYSTYTITYHFIRLGSSTLHIHSSDGRIVLNGILHTTTSQGLNLQPGANPYAPTVASVAYPHASHSLTLRPNQETRLKVEQEFPGRMSGHLFGWHPSAAQVAASAWVTELRHNNQLRRIGWVAASEAERARGWARKCVVLADRTADDVVSVGQVLETLGWADEACERMSILGPGRMPSQRGLVIILGFLGLHERERE